MCDIYYFLNKCTYISSNFLILISKISNYSTYTKKLRDFIHYKKLKES